MIIRRRHHPRIAPRAASVPTGARSCGAGRVSGRVGCEGPSMDRCWTCAVLYGTDEPADHYVWVRNEPDDPGDWTMHIRLVCWLHAKGYPLDTVRKGPVPDDARHLIRGALARDNLKSQ